MRILEASPERTEGCQITHCREKHTNAVVRLHPEGKLKVCKVHGLFAMSQGLSVLMEIPARW